MSEVFFILTTIYVAYVVYKISEDTKQEKRTSKPAPAESIMTPSGSISVTETAFASSEFAAEEPKVVEKTPEPKPEPKAEKVEAAPVSSSNLRDPKTGETAKVTNNYRGLKRWLKEALVAEGLLEKVYSNNELNDANNAKIKKALDAIKTMSKYHA